jgi:hypothetical protein
MSNKYEPAILPTKELAITMAGEREAWAAQARERASRRDRPENLN